jgi:putative Ca2+/H+ antiporter (TMEM165/GDT1 family)
MLEAFITAAITIFVAELGDKTQLFALALSAKTHRPWSVLAGVAAGALLLIAPAAWIGFSAAQLIDAQMLRYVSAALLFAFALWIALRGADEDDDTPHEALKRSTAWAVFTAAALGFALAELGDKSQIAVLLLGARTEHVWAVVGGAWLGEVAAMAPAALAGKAIAARVSPKMIRIAAASLFAALGLWTLLN